jgi:hypothetical protein
MEDGEERGRKQIQGESQVKRKDRNQKRKDTGDLPQGGLLKECPPPPNPSELHTGPRSKGSLGSWSLIASCSRKARE